MADEADDGALAGPRAQGLAVDGAPVEPWRAERVFVPKRAVRWLSPGELARSGVAAVLATSFGQFFDRREAIANAIDPAEWRSHDRSDVEWVDFVADTGDGFDATYAVAAAVARDTLPGCTVPDCDVPGCAGADGQTHRGRVLILGGDEIYPVPVAGVGGESNYHDRLVGPWEAALQRVDAPGEEPHQHAYVIPGNHDWYDGLAAFRKQFLTGRWFAAWKTEQRASYFAVKIADGWWLWGIDIALDGPLDAAQVAYFRRVAAEEVRSGDGIVLCCAKPAWVRSAPPRPPSRFRRRLGGEPASPSEPYDLLRYLVSQTLGTRSSSVRVMLSGDLHHYARYTERPATGPPPDNPRVKITAGGGGAFLSLTTNLPDELSIREPGSGAGGRDRTRYVTEQEDHVWPARADSRGPITASALWRVWTSPSLALLTGGLYVLLVLLLQSRHDDGFAGAVESVGQGVGSGWWELARTGAGSVTAWLAVLATAGAALAFAVNGVRPLSATGLRVPKGWRALLLGLLHVGLIVSGVLVTGALSMWAGAAASRTWLVGLVFAGSLVVSAAVVSMTAFALYLVVAGLFGHHANDVSVAVRHQGWKNFIRMRVRDDGDLEIFAYGIRDVPARDARFVVGDDGRGHLELRTARSSAQCIDHLVVSKDPA